MNLQRRITRRLQRDIGFWLHRGGPLRRRVYYRLFSKGFSREQDAVGAGISKYLRTTTAHQSELYLLRRNIHMMEKGLTMQPRRDKFAMEYNRETVDAYCEVVTRLQNSDWMCSEEHNWIRSVLTEYFCATRSAKDSRIAELEEKFAKVNSELHTSSPNFGPSPPDGGSPTISIEDLQRLSLRRRSVRWFLDQPVEREDIDAAVRVAQQAPTACNRQPYHFRIFDDRESVAKIAAIPMGTAGYRHQLPGIIVVVGDLSAFFDERDRHLIYIDSSLSVMGLLLGLEAQGISSCIINWPDMPEREREMKHLLDLPDYQRVVMLIAFGYADPNGLTPFSGKRSLDATRTFEQIGYQR